MRKFTINAIPVLLGLALLAGCGSSSSNTSSPATSGNGSASSGASAATVKTASVPSVSGTVLVNADGMTLYHLSAESNGKFICTTAECEAVWHPLVASGTPTGAESLGTVKRPNGQVQVTYKSMPLYTFASDTPGQAKGQGIKDVGTWTVVTTGASSASAPAATTPSTSTSSESSGSKYGY